MASASDVTAALDANAADPSAPLGDDVRDAYLNDFEAFTAGFRAFAEHTHDDVVNRVRAAVAKLNPEPAADAEA